MAPCIHSFIQTFASGSCFSCKGVAHTEYATVGESDVAADESRIVLRSLFWSEKSAESSDRHTWSGPAWVRVTQSASPNQPTNQPPSAHIPSGKGGAYLIELEPKALGLDGKRLSTR